MQHRGFEFKGASQVVVISAVNNIHGAQTKLTNTLERITTGNRINSAADDAAGLSLSSQQSTDNASLKVAMRNISEGISLVQTAEGSFSTLTDILVRMRELSVQSATDLYADRQRDMMNTEFSELALEYDRIVDIASQYNTHKLLDGSVSSLKLQAGHINNASHQIFTQHIKSQRYICCDWVGRSLQYRDIHNNRCTIRICDLR